MAIPITVVAPAIVALDGGTEILLTGTFPAGDLTVRVGPTGTSSDPACYSGTVGQGYTCQRTDATTLSAITPPLSRGNNKVSVYSVGDSGLWAGTLIAVEHRFLTSIFELRKVFPPWVDTGPRDLYLEPRQDAVAGYSEPVKSPSRAIFEAVGEALGLHAGVRLTRLRAPVVAGATELPVESALEFTSTGGTAWLGNESAAITYTGIDAAPGAARLTGVSGVLLDHREETEVAEYNRDWSQLDQLRRALQVDYAEGIDLDRLARRHGVKKPRGMTEAMFRGLIKTIAYLERGPIYALEQVLDVLYPAGGYEIYESLVEHPLQIDIRIPGYIGDDPAGRCFMMARDESAMGGVQQFTCSNDPTTVEQVVVPVQTEEEVFTALPSAFATPWTFVAENLGVEGAYFSIIPSNRLEQIMPLGFDCGRYRRVINELGQDLNRLDMAWRWEATALVNDHPWKMVFRDGWREYCLMWNLTEAVLGQVNEVPVAGPYVFPAPLGPVWQYPTLERNGGTVTARWNGITILSAPADSFAASAIKEVSFGFFFTANLNNWVVQWKWIRDTTRDLLHNYWNLQRADGALAIGVPQLNSASAPFVAGHVGKRVRFIAVNSENAGVWQITTLNSPVQVVFDGVVYDDGYCDSLAPDRLYSYSPHFEDGTASKSIIITAGPNAGTYAVAARISPFEVRLTGATLVTEESTSWKFDPAGVVNEAAMAFEIIDAGTIAGPVLTLPDPVFGLPFNARADYTTVLSGQMLRNETISNATGTDYWPFYVTGVNERIQAILKEIVVAGVTPKFNRI